jgi:serine/threonine protein kinase
MAKKDYYSVLGIPKTATSDQIKKAFRELAREFHPDINKSHKAEDRFKEIAAAYEVLSDQDKKEKYDKYGDTRPAILQTKKNRYTIEGLVTSGDLSDIYKAVSSSGTYVAIKVARDPRNNDLLESEWKVLKEVRPHDAKEEKVMRFFPTPVESLKINDGSHRQANIMLWAEDFISLETVRTLTGGKLPFEHGAWILRRLLAALSYLHDSPGYVHGALTPDHILVYAGNPGIYDHGIKIVDWAYAVKIGQPLKIISPKYEPFYPPEMPGKNPTTTSIDIYMAVKCINYVMGGRPSVAGDYYPSHVPKYLANFLKACTFGTISHRPHDAYELLKEFKDYMQVYYGPRKYIPFNLPSR